MKSLFALPVFLMFLGSFSQASANINWTLNATFSDDAVAVGSFVTDNAGTNLITFDYQVTGGAPIHDFHVSSSIQQTTHPWTLTTTPAATWPTNTVQALTFAPQGFSTYTTFYFGNLLSTGGPIQLVGGLDCGGSCGSLKSGTLVDPPAGVPEPDSIVLFGSATLCFVFVARRRLAKNLAA